jgi:hypothetical protein
LVQFAAAIAAGGSGAMFGYARVMSSVQQIGDLIEPRPGDSLRAFFKVFVPWETPALLLYGAAGALAVVMAARTWRSHAPFALRASAVVIATILISPHAFGYDLILLAPVYLVLADHLAGEAATDLPSSAAERVMAWSLCALFFAPLFTALPAVIRLQFSVSAMAALLTAMSHSSRPYTLAPVSKALAPVRLQPATR